MENKVVLKLDLCKTWRLRLQGGVRTPGCGTSSPSVGKAGGMEGTHRPAQLVGTFANDMTPASRLQDAQSTRACHCPAQRGKDLDPAVHGDTGPHSSLTLLQEGHPCCPHSRALATRGLVGFPDGPCAQPPSRGKRRGSCSSGWRHLDQLRGTTVPSLGMLTGLPGSSAIVQEMWVLPPGWDDPLRGKWQPTPYSCLENPVDRGAWGYSSCGRKSRIRFSLSAATTGQCRPVLDTGRPGLV